VGLRTFPVDCLLISRVFLAVFCSNPSADELQPSVKYRRDSLFHEGELITLKGPDIDFKGGFIHVQRNLSRGKISVTKNGKDRKVDMSTQLANTLDELLSRRRAEALREEMKKPAQERRDTATGVNDVMENWLFQTPVMKRSELAKRRRPKADPRAGDPSRSKQPAQGLQPAIG